jgi:hypothetical protein
MIAQRKPSQIGKDDIQCEVDSIFELGCGSDIRIRPTKQVPVGSRRQPKHHESTRFLHVSGNKRSEKPDTDDSSSSLAHRRPFGEKLEEHCRLIQPPISNSMADTDAAGNSQLPFVVNGFAIVFITAALFRKDNSTIGSSLISNTRPLRMELRAIWIVALTGLFRSILAT